MKQFVALARVSSREQERFSLEAQENVPKRYAAALVQKFMAGQESVRLRTVFILSQVNKFQNITCKCFLLKTV